MTTTENVGNATEVLEQALRDAGMKPDATDARTILHILAALGWKVVPDAIEREALAEGIAIGKQQERERIGAAAESEIRLVRGRPMVPMGTLDAILAEPSE